MSKFVNRKGVEIQATDRSEVRPSKVLGVQFFKPFINENDQEKGAVVALNWWNTFNKEYEKRFIVVSKSRGKQFARTQ